ncbi:Uncharacterized protein SCF082_LOCUS34740 [Durusdinium trenchii]|uniref:Uncharacterized protein n=1 Tax=Durusdinium trenchii TaxID=1381693 RepID=A0ABP0P152_9DINO
MPAQPNKKLKRLNDLRRQVPHCTKEALHKILENVEEFGIPEAHAPRDMRQAAYEELAQWDAYGPMLITKELVVSAGSQVTLTIVNFLTLLHACYKQGGFFYHLVRDTVKKAWLAFCHVLDLLICTMYGHPINPLDLDHAVQKALQLGSDALWEDSFIRKFHWLLHYGDSIRDHGTLIACWAMERRHKRITNVANCYSNLVSYEKSLYVEVLGEELYRLKAGQLPVPGLVHLGKAPQGLKSFVQDFLADAQNKDIYTCSKLNLDRGGQAAQGDVVLVQSDALQWDCGELLKIFGVCKEAFCIIGFYTLANAPAAAAAAAAGATGAADKDPTDPRKAADAKADTRRPRSPEKPPKTEEKPLAKAAEDKKTKDGSGYCAQCSRHIRGGASGMQQHCRSAKHFAYSLWASNSVKSWNDALAEGERLSDLAWQESGLGKPEKMPATQTKETRPFLAAAGRGRSASSSLKKRRAARSPSPAQPLPGTRRDPRDPDGGDGDGDDRARLLTALWEKTLNTVRTW